MVIDGDDSMPDCVFIEDTVVMFGDLAVITIPLRPSRNLETVAVQRVIEELVSKPPDHRGKSRRRRRPEDRPAGVRRTQRHDNSPAIDQLTRILSPRGYTVTAVPLTKALHLKSAVTALPDGTVIGYEPLVDDASIFPKFLAVPEEQGAHVVILGDDLLLMSSDAPRTAEMLRARLPLGNRRDLRIRKLEGCVTCLRCACAEPAGAGATKGRLRHCCRLTPIREPENGSRLDHTHRFHRSAAPGHVRGRMRAQR